MPKSCQYMPNNDALLLFLFILVIYLFTGKHVFIGCFKAVFAQCKMFSECKIFLGENIFSYLVTLWKTCQKMISSVWFACKIIIGKYVYTPENIPISLSLSLGLGRARKIRV